MNDDELRDDLRERLQRIDPVPDEVALESPTSPSARQRLEHIMNTDTRIPTSASPGPRKRYAWLAGAAAAAVVALGVGIAVNGGDDAPEEATAPMELTVGADNAMASCMRLDAEVLRTMSPAFSGTVTSIEGETITLSVDNWYAGGDADTVVLHAEAGLEALIGSIDFQVGDQYFITASGGSVNYCGYSGPLSDPGLASVVTEAFG